jgi:hypothetical protein
MADGKIVIDTAVDNDGLTRGIQQVERKLHNLSDAFKGVFDGLQNPFEGLDKALPVSPLDAALKGLAGFAIAGTVSNAVGILAGAVGGLSSQLTAATAGLGAFAVVAGPTISNLFEINEALKEGEMKWSELSDAQHDAIHSLRDFKGFFEGFRKQFEEPILESFSKGLGIVEDVLTDLNPLFQTSVDTVNDLMTSLSESVNSEDMQEFFTFLNEEGAPAFERLSKTAGNFLAGFLNMMEAFGPLGVDMSEGLLGMSEDFRTWAATLEENQQFQDFIKYVEEHGPEMLQNIEDIFGLLIQLGKDFAPVGAAILDFFGDWSKKQKEMNEKFKGYVEEQGGFLGVLEDAWGKATDGIVGYINEQLDEWKEIEEYFEGLSFYEGLKKIGKDAIEGLIAGFKSLNIPEPHFNTSGSFGWSLKSGFSFPSVDVDWYKDGAVFPANSPRLAGIGDASVQEAAIPLSPQVLGKIGSKIAETMSGNGSVTNNFKGMYDGATFHIREEADIDKLSEEFSERIAQQSRY